MTSLLCLKYYHHLIVLLELVSQVLMMFSEVEMERKSGGDFFEVGLSGKIEYVRGLELGRAKKRRAKKSIKRTVLAAQETKKCWFVLSIGKRAWNSKVEI